MIDTGLVVSSEKEAKDVVTHILSQKYAVDLITISNCITNVTTRANTLSDGEDIYIVHKVTKSNKNKLVYVHFAYWML